MPPAEPLVVDFGLGDYHRVGLIEFWIANEIEAARPLLMLLNQPVVGIEGNSWEPS